MLKLCVYYMTTHKGIYRFDINLPKRHIYVTCWRGFNPMNYMGLVVSGNF